MKNTSNKNNLLMDFPVRQRGKNKFKHINRKHSNRNTKSKKCQENHFLKNEKYIITKWVYPRNAKFI